jgi:hypothetical protein
VEEIALIIGAILIRWAGSGKLLELLNATLWKKA